MKLQRAPAAAAQAWYIYKEHHQTLLLQCCLHLNITKSSQCSQKTIASLKISMFWENINYLCYSPAWSVISKPGPKPLNSSLFAKCNWIFPLSIGKISTSNNMFGRTIWECRGQIARVHFWKFCEGNFKIFKNHEGNLSPKSPNQTCGYWLITPNQQTFCIETNIF